MLENLSPCSVMFLAQDAVTSIDQLNRTAAWWGKLGNVLFGGVIVVLVIFVLLTFWRRSVNKAAERQAKLAKVDEILAEQPASSPTDSSPE